MKDTNPKIEQKFRAMLLKRSGEERLKMGCSMHATSRALVKASILAKNPGVLPVGLKQSLFLHFYGNEFSPRARKKIVLALEKAAQNRKDTMTESRESK